MLRKILDSPHRTVQGPCSFTNQGSQYGAKIVGFLIRTPEPPKYLKSLPLYEDKRSKGNYVNFRYFGGPVTAQKGPNLQKQPNPEAWELEALPQSHAAEGSRLT